MGGRGRRERALLERIPSLEAGQDRTALATVLGELVDYYWEVGRHESAEAPMLRRLALFQQTRGPKHTTVARCLHDLAFLYDKFGRDAAAEEFASRAMAMWSEIDGYANGHTCRMLELLARLYARQARAEKLGALIGSAIGELERTFPRGYHDPSLASLANLLSDSTGATELHDMGERIRALLA